MTAFSSRHSLAPVVAIESVMRQTEKRSHDRHLTIFRVAKFTCGGREGLGVVRNLSAGGMKIDAYMPMAVGERVSVSLRDGHQLEATVIWQQDESVGIKFDQMASVEQLLAIPVKAARGKALRPPRITANRSALLRWSKMGPLNVEVADLSQRGAKICTKASLSINENVSLELPGLPQQTATVRWIRPGEAGLAFHGVIAVKALMEWLLANGEEEGKPA